MLSLLFITIATSAVDSLNPIAITQQFILQGLVKKPWHIWFFIMATWLTNFASGILFYYGILSVFSNVFSHLKNKYSQVIFVVLFALGLSIIIYTLYSIYKKKTAKINSEEGEDEAEIASKIKSVSPVSLFLLGVGATVAELTSALPYFAFLAILMNYELNLFWLLFILVIYNTIYASPFAVLYFIYKIKQDMFERIYLFLKSKIARWSEKLVWTVFFIIGSGIIYYAFVI